MGSDPPVGVLVMAYGTASGPDDIERYYTDIRGGRTPSPEHLAELRSLRGDRQRVPAAGHDPRRPTASSNG